MAPPGWLDSAATVRRGSYDSLFNLLHQPALSLPFALAGDSPATLCVSPSCHVRQAPGGFAA